MTEDSQARRKTAWRDARGWVAENISAEILEQVYRRRFSFINQATLEQGMQAMGLVACDECVSHDQTGLVCASPLMVTRSYSTDALGELHRVVCHNCGFEEYWNVSRANPTDGHYDAGQPVLVGAGQSNYQSNYSATAAHIRRWPNNLSKP